MIELESSTFEEVYGPVCLVEFLTGILMCWEFLTSLPVAFYRALEISFLVVEFQKSSPLKCPLLPFEFFKLQLCKCLVILKVFENPAKHLE